MATENIKPLVVIAGPTASGKTSLAIKLTQQFNGEIICADSRTIYRGMDVGTAKPTKNEQKMVPHWGLDLVNPGDRFSAADFKRYAEAKIEEIRSRNHVPFLVGGTGLYIDAILFDFEFGPDMDDDLRTNLLKLSVGELQKYCVKNNIELPENSQNHRYLVRAIERSSMSIKRRSRPIGNSIAVAITTHKQEHRTNIELRAEQIITPSVVKEATTLADQYGWDNEAMTGNIYRLIKKQLDGEISTDQLKEKFITSDWRLAKRQMTWLRRSPHILWGDLEAVEHYLSDRLANI